MAGRGTGGTRAGEGTRPGGTPGTGEEAAGSAGYRIRGQEAQEEEDLCRGDTPPPWWNEAMRIEREKFREDLLTKLELDGPKVDELD